ncbi:MAG: Ig-like domain-containing protein [Candidatus Longimicrobiales bacterium M2_2A_002]
MESGLRTTHAILLLPAILLSAIAWAACGDGATGPGGGGEGPPIARITVSPPADTLTALGDTIRLVATALDADGDDVVGVSFDWNSTDDGVAVVDGEGVVESVGNGETAITAEADGVVGSAAVAVAQRVAGVTVSPGTATLSTVGETLQLSASATDENGTAVTDAVFVWQSMDHAVATVSPAGVVTARGSGAVVVTATAQDVPGHAELLVDQRVDHLAFRTQPTSATAGAAIDPAVQVEVLDAAGHVVEDAELAVTLWPGTNPAGGTLGGTATVHATAGVATFSGLWVDAAGSGYTLEATAGGAGAATSHTFDITPGPPDQLAFTAGPTSATAGQSIGSPIQVEIQDAYGNRSDTATAVVSLQLGSNPGDTELEGTTTADAINGVASFGDLSLRAAASGYRLRALADELGETLSAAFDIAPAAATRLAYLSPPTDVEGQELFDPVRVAVQDSFGNVVTGSAATVSVELGRDPTFGEATLTGPTMVSAIEGLATFDSLAMALPADGYALDATATGLSRAASDWFAVDLTFVRIRAGGGHSCGITVPGHAYCWGADDRGQLGNAVDALYFDSPRPVAGGHALVQVSTGANHTCGVTTDSAVLCWGDNDRGQLGDGTTTDRPIPAPVSTSASFVQVSAGANHTCGLTATGELLCWGANAFGQLGDGSSTDSSTPVAVSSQESFARVSAGSEFTCATTTADTAFCWGLNNLGQLGNGTTTSSSTPTAVAGGQAYTEVDAGDDHACGVTSADDAYCWGANGFGQLGDGTATSRSTPAAVAGGYSFRTVTAGTGHTCAISSNDGGYCWGQNDQGQLGTGSTTNWSAPQPIATEAPLDRLVAGAQHSCGVTALGEALCWGSNFSGQLGDGDTEDRLEPALVVQ